MNDYKELLKALRSCQHIASNCIDCPLANTKYYNPKTHECEVHLHNIASDAIEQLVRERDAAVEDLKSLAFCNKCKHNETTEGFNDICLYCREDDKWEWRGVQE